MKTQDLGEVDGVLLLFSISNALLVSLKLIHHFEPWAIKDLRVTLNTSSIAVQDVN